MFTIKDFPVGSYLFWIRSLANITEPELPIVYTKYKISGHDQDENLLSELAKSQDLTEGEHFILKNHQEFKIIHLKEKYLKPSPRDLIIPETVFNSFHHPELLPATSLAQLQKLVGTGNAQIDRSIRQASLSFKDWHNNHRLQQYFPLKKTPINLAALPEGECLILNPKYGT